MIEARYRDLVAHLDDDKSDPTSWFERLDHWGDEVAMRARWACADLLLKVWERDTDRLDLHEIMGLGVEYFLDAKETLKTELRGKLQTFIHEQRKQHCSRSATRASMAIVQVFYALLGECSCRFSEFPYDYCWRGHKHGSLSQFIRTTLQVLDADSIKDAVRADLVPWLLGGEDPLRASGEPEWIL